MHQQQMEEQIAEEQAADPSPADHAEQFRTSAQGQEIAGDKLQ
jgi:hypothetical protein